MLAACLSAVPAPPGPHCLRQHTLPDMVTYSARRAAGARAVGAHGPGARRAAGRVRRADVRARSRRAAALAPRRRGRGQLLREPVPGVRGRAVRSRARLTQRRRGKRACPDRRQCGAGGDCVRSARPAHAALAPPLKAAPLQVRHRQSAAGWGRHGATRRSIITVCMPAREQPGRTRPWRQAASSTCPCARHICTRGGTEHAGERLPCCRYHTCKCLAKLAREGAPGADALSDSDADAGEEGAAGDAVRAAHQCALAGQAGLVCHQQACCNDKATDSLRVCSC